MNKKILIVEDDLTLFQIYMDLFIEKGFDVKGAKTGQEAVALIESEKPDLIILDIMLPEKNPGDYINQLGLGRACCQSNRSKKILSQSKYNNNRSSKCRHGIISLICRVVNSLLLLSYGNRQFFWQPQRITEE